MECIHVEFLLEGVVMHMQVCYNEKSVYNNGKMT